jgi:hypothetical protein
MKKEMIENNQQIDEMIKVTTGGHLREEKEYYFYLHQLKDCAFNEIVTILGKYKQDERFRPKQLL